jgi:hypothetical protein
MIAKISDSTSPSGPFFGPQLREPLVVGFIAVGIGTFTQALPAIIAFQAARPQQQTRSGYSVELREPAPRVIAEIRHLTGLTWEQLAQVFNVSRRSVHFWASGCAGAIPPCGCHRAARLRGPVSGIHSQSISHLAPGITRTSGAADRGSSRG